MDIVSQGFLGAVLAQSVAKKHWSAVITQRGSTIRIISVRAPVKQRWNSMKAKDFDKKFDDNKQDIIDELDLSTINRPN